MEQLRSGKLANTPKAGSKAIPWGLSNSTCPTTTTFTCTTRRRTQLFSRSRRDFSHGCIRVEDPVELAAWVLRDKPEWDREHILEAMNGDETFRVNLSKPIPVLILYGTAIVTESGEVHFFDDIYGLDSELQQRLAQGISVHNGRMNFGSRAPQQTLANLGGMDLPAANRPEIHVDKLRLGIVADTAAVQAERGVAQASGGNSGNANVDGLAEHVLAVLRDPDRRAAQKFVAPRRAIAANDVNLGAGMARPRLVKSLSKSKRRGSRLVTSPVR